MQSTQIVNIVFQDGVPTEFTRTPEMIALIERARKYTELEQAARELIQNTHGVLDDSVPNNFKAHLTIGDVRKLAALLQGKPKE